MLPPPQFLCQFLVSNYTLHPLLDAIERLEELSHKSNNTHVIKQVFITSIYQPIYQTLHQKVNICKESDKWNWQMLSTIYSQEHEINMKVVGSVRHTYILCKL